MEKDADPAGPVDCRVGRQVVSYFLPQNAGIQPLPVGGRLE